MPLYTSNKIFFHIFENPLTTLKMSSKYMFKDNSKLYFVTFTITNWLDLFIRNEYKEILLNSLTYCQKEKDLELYCWCIMTSHVHLIIGTKGNALSNIVRDLKRHTSEQLHKAIKNNRTPLAQVFPPKSLNRNENTLGSLDAV